MEVDRTGTANTAQETEAVKANATQRKPLTDEQRQALRTLGACFYCRNTGHLARDCPEKPKRGQDRRALPAQKPVRPLPPPKTKNRSTEVEGETIVLTQENFRTEIIKLDEDDH